jgi:hypothetical protein
MAYGGGVQRLGVSQQPYSSYSPQAPCVFGASNPVSDDEVYIPCLHVPPPRRPSAHAAAASLADSDDVVPIPRFSPCSALTYIDKGRYES